MSVSRLANSSDVLSLFVIICSSYDNISATLGIAPIKASFAVQLFVSLLSFKYIPPPLKYCAKQRAYKTYKDKKSCYNAKYSTDYSFEKFE